MSSKCQNQLIICRYAFNQTIMLTKIPVPIKPLNNLLRLMTNAILSIEQLNLLHSNCILHILFVISDMKRSKKKKTTEQEEYSVEDNEFVVRYNQN